VSASSSSSETILEVHCAFCGAVFPSNDVVTSSGKAAICRGCVGAGLVATMATARARGMELPTGDLTCSFCAKKAPASSSYRATQGEASACIECLGRAYWFAANTEALRERRQTWAYLDARTPLGLLRNHFATVGVENVVTASRTFPKYMRVDLNVALTKKLAREDVSCIGIHRRYAHETLHYATLLDGETQVSIAPLQYDETDVGEDVPARCLKCALWLVPDPKVPHAVLLSEAQRYGDSSGWYVEIAVPPGIEGDEVTRSYFKTLEESLQRSTSYRGKVLSLEQGGHVRGTGGTVRVHRLRPVAREDVILPETTLRLLERNVFRFAEHRASLRELGLPVKKGLLFYGPPGTGKTHTIRYLAGALPGHTTLLITAEQVALLEEYMTLARLLSPSIVVIEDADLIARERESMDGPCEEVLLNRLLNEMDGLKENAEILFVLTTNRPASLEAALRARPGRIDQAIEFPLPDGDGRRKLARLYGRGARISNAAFEHVVERTAGVSAAFLKELMRRSVQFALEHAPSPEIGTDDVDAALDELLFSGGQLNAALLGAAGRPAKG
jgi:hypothetical protein